MNLLTRFPIRVSIPVILFLLTFLVEGFTMNYNENRADREEEHRAIALVTQDMTLIQETINHQLRKGDLEGVQMIISNRGSNPNIIVEALIDDAKIITYATNLKLIGEPAVNALPEINTALIGEVSNSLNGKVLLTDNRQYISAYYPIILGTKAGEIRPNRVGILYQLYDLATEKANRRYMQEKQLFTMFGFYAGSFFLLFLFLHLMINRRVSRLVSATRRFASGDFGTHANLEGEDEFALIGKHIDLMAKEIAGNQETLHQLNRKLQAISNCGQLLVRAEDEQTLLNKVCQIVCDKAGYRMTWVGYALNDEAKTILPRAWAGAESGYLTQAGLTWADTERGRGPAGIAIRTGRSACFQDFASEPSASPWRENAIQRGYRSSLALPLKDEKENTFGILAIYSSEPETFTPDEIHLLEQLSEDLAFGIISLRNRNERLRLQSELSELNANLKSRVKEEVAKNREKDHILIHQSRLAAMGEMVHNIAHQWRQPLNSLSIILTNLQDEYDYNELTSDSLGRMIKKSHELLFQMSATIDDFKDFFRPDREPAQFEMSRPVENALHVMEETLKNNSINVEKNLPEGLMVFGYSNQFSQVILNILANAKEAIQLRAQSEGRINISLTESDNNGILRIQDNGGGIPEDVLPRIFDPYFTTKEKGSGIGLYMSKMIIERNLNGTIQANNTDQGTLITITLPLQGGASTSPA